MDRSYFVEMQWQSHPIIGYVPLDAEGKPYQPMLGTSWRARKKPVTVYKTLQMALKQSPVGSASEVRMFQPHYVTEVEEDGN